jgi:hypothetical protein
MIGSRAIRMAGFHTRVRYHIATIEENPVERGLAVPGGGTTGAGQAKVIAAIVGFTRFFLHTTAAIQVLTAGGRTTEPSNAQGGTSFVVCALVTFTASTAIWNGWKER